jgi:hypothetical protein
MKTPTQNDEQQLAQRAAEWMCDEVLRSGWLDQAHAADEIERRFGASVVYINDSGNTAIARPVLAAFHRLTSDTVVWEKRDKAWRKREPADEEGKRGVD